MFGLLYSVQLLIPEHFIQNPLSSPAEYLRGLLVRSHTKLHSVQADLITRQSILLDLWT